MGKYCRLFSPRSWSVIGHVISCTLQVELVDPAADSILVFFSLGRVITSIFRYINQLANELPQPLLMFPVFLPQLSLRLIIPWSQHSQKRRHSSYNRYSYRNKLDIGKYTVVDGTSSAVRKYSKALCIDIR